MKMLKLSLSMKKWDFNVRDLQARSLFSWFSRGFFVSANCERRNAENMMTHPRISRPAMTSWRKIPPHKAAKTDSMLMIMAASAVHDRLPFNILPDDSNNSGHQSCGHKGNKGQSDRVGLLGVMVDQQDLK